VKYNLWDTESSSFLGHFEDESEVMTLVRTLISHYGDAYAHDLGLGRVTDDGEILEALSGASLIARADEVLGDLSSADERQGVVIASHLQVRKVGMSIEPMAAAANRVIRRFTEASHRRIQRN
jgi:hypothetical protein